MKKSAVFTFSLLVLCAVSVQAEITLEDKFELEGRPPGATLNRQPVGTSGTIWEASANVVFAPAGGLRVKDATGYGARIELPEGFKSVTLEAKIQPVPAVENPGWMAVGLGNAEQVSNPTFGGLYVIIYSTGNYALMFNPDPADGTSKLAKTLVRGRANVFDPDNLNTVKLTYHQDEGTIDLTINDDLAVDAFSIKDKGIKLDARYGGFSGYSQVSEARSIGGFSVSVVQ